MRGKPEKSFKRITEALTQKFPQPLGMLDDMLTQVEELMGKHNSRCPCSHTSRLVRYFGKDLKCSVPCRVFQN